MAEIPVSAVDFNHRLSLNFTQIFSRANLDSVNIPLKCAEHTAQNKQDLYMWQIVQPNKHKWYFHTKSFFVRKISFKAYPWIFASDLQLVCHRFGHGLALFKGANPHPGYPTQFLCEIFAEFASRSDMSGSFFFPTRRFQICIGKNPSCGNYSAFSQ